jgi:hypothetical protein
MHKTQEAALVNTKSMLCEGSNQAQVHGRVNACSEVDT